MPEQYHATKYDSARDEVIAYLADEMEGFGQRDDTGGDSEAPTGYFQLVVLDDTCDLDVQDASTNYPPGDLVGETARTYGVTAEDVRGVHIVTTNSQGFVSVETFDTEQQGRDALACLVARYAAYDDEDRDPDDDGVFVCPVAGHGYHSASV